MLCLMRGDIRYPTVIDQIVSLVRGADGVPVAACRETRSLALLRPPARLV
jgi:hypothetical protein